MIKFIPGGVTAPKGFLANGIHCGIRKNKSKLDLALIFSTEECDAAAVYTQNLVKGAPIEVTKRSLQNGKARAVICNSGIANTCNADGVEKAEAMCRIAANALGIAAEDVIVASTGVIGQPLNLEPIKNGIGELKAGLSPDGSDAATRAIMTTDVRKKEAAVEFLLGGKTCRIGGICKGSGMINPNMATMLCFLTTDANISPDMLKKALLQAVENSFNMVSIDGDTSTNDMVSIMASGLAGNARVTGGGVDHEAFADALTQLCVKLSRDVARDGEGATKLIECAVSGAKTEKDAKAVAKTVIGSSLVKTAMFGADANWGRVLCAIGYSGADVDIAGAGVAFSSKSGRVEVCRGGAGIAFSEEDAKRVLLEDEVIIEVTLADGDSSAIAFGCDLTYDYVKINGDYRT